MILAFAGPAMPREVLLGSNKLSFGFEDRDVLTITSCRDDRFDRDRDDRRDDRGRRRDDRRRDDGRIRAFRFVVSKARADVNRIDVEYGNGRRDAFYINQEFRKGESSRYYDLRGGARCIRTITVYGKTDRNIFKKARLTFYGLEQFLV